MRPLAYTVQSVLFIIKFVAIINYEFLLVAFIIYENINVNKLIQTKSINKG